MMRTANARFLEKLSLWSTLTKLLESGNNVAAAIAYFGNGGSELLPLTDGDLLVVDMSMPTVKAGATNPYEIEKLVMRGVRVYWSPRLHSKVVVIGNLVIAGSANVSTRSKDLLCEAAILIDDRAISRQARKFIGNLCTRPVDQEYLTRLCLRPTRCNRDGSGRAYDGVCWKASPI